MRTFIVITLAVIVCFASISADEAKVEPSNQQGELKTNVSSPGNKTDANSKKPMIKQGIEVHGLWSIEIRDTDGKRVSVTKFENGLSGQYGLSLMLGRSDSFYGSYGGWQIYIQGNPVSPCGIDPCLIASNSFDCNPVSEIDSTNLAVTIEGTSGDEYIHLSGNVTASETTTVYGVGTRVKICSNSILPSNCPTANTQCDYKDFTYHSLSPVVDVQAGQQILVDIDIVFE